MIIIEILPILCSYLSSGHLQTVWKPLLFPAFEPEAWAGELWNGSWRPESQTGGHPLPLVSPPSDPASGRWRRVVPMPRLVHWRFSYRSGLLAVFSKLWRNAGSEISSSQAWITSQKHWASCPPTPASQGPWPLCCEWRQCGGGVGWGGWLLAIASSWPCTVLVGTTLGMSRIGMMGA